MKKTYTLAEFKKVCRVGMEFEIFGKKNGLYRLGGFNENQIFYECIGELQSGTGSMYFYRGEVEITITKTPKIDWDNLRANDKIVDESNTNCFKYRVLERVGNLLFICNDDSVMKNFRDVSRAAHRIKDLKRLSFTIIQPDTVEEKPKRQMTLDYLKRHKFRVYAADEMKVVNESTMVAIKHSGRTLIIDGEEVEIVKE